MKGVVGKGVGGQQSVRCVSKEEEGGITKGYKRYKRPLNKLHLQRGWHPEV